MPSAGRGRSHTWWGAVQAADCDDTLSCQTPGTRKVNVCSEGAWRATQVFKSILLVYSWSVCLAFLGLLAYGEAMNRSGGCGR